MGILLCKGPAECRVPGIVARRVLGLDLLPARNGPAGGAFGQHLSVLSMGIGDPLAVKHEPLVASQIGRERARLNLCSPVAVLPQSFARGLFFRMCDVRSLPLADEPEEHGGRVRASAVGPFGHRDEFDFGRFAVVG